MLLDPGNNLLAAIERRYRLNLYFVASAARAERGSLADLQEATSRAEPRGESSRLGTGLRHVLSDLRGTPPAAIVLLTDGINTDGPTLADAARGARHKGVPLFTVGLGSEQPVRDVELADLLVDEVVFVDDVVNFQFKLSATGLAGKTVDVVLREKDNPDGARRNEGRDSSDDGNAAAAAVTLSAHEGRRVRVRRRGRTACRRSSDRKQSPAAAGQRAQGTNQGARWCRPIRTTSSAT